MQLQKIPVGMLRTNCYIVMDESSAKVIVIDPGSEAERLMHWIRENQWDVEAILLTHGHFDHIGAVEGLKNHSGAPVYIHKKDAVYLGNPQYNLSASFAGENISCHADHILAGGEELDFVWIKLSVLHTPGHTPGGVCYYEKDQKLLFSGDTLFAGAIGRTDLLNGNHGELIEGIQNKLLCLPEDVAVYPGHGEPTTIGNEKVSNPYISELFWE